MGMTKNKKMLIKGAGKFMAKIPNSDELITIGTLNNMLLDIQLDMHDIEGGDSSVPLDALLRKKTIDITAQDAKFDLNLVRLVLGSKLREGVSGASYRLTTETVTVPGESPYQVLLTEAAATSPAMKAYEDVITGTDVTTEVTVTGNKAVFDAALVREKVVIVYPVALSGIQQDDDGFVWELEEKHVIQEVNGKCEAELVFGTSLHTTPEISVRTLNGNKLLKRSLTGTPTEEQYLVEGGKLIFNAALKDVAIYVNYKRNEVVDVLDISSRDLPLTVHLVHDGTVLSKRTVLCKDTKRNCINVV